MIDTKLAEQPIDVQMQAGHNIINSNLRKGEPNKNRNLVFKNPSVLVKKTDKEVVIPVNKLPTVQLFSREKVMSTKGKARKSDQREELMNFAKESEDKPLAIIEHDTMDKLKVLGEQFPNFMEVVDRYRESLVLLSLAENVPIWFPPMLLVGPAGVGKTRFLSDLAKVINTGFYPIDMSTITTGAVLSGGSSQWADSKPGFVTNSLRDSAVANPIILIDEVDKASGDTRYNPIGSLYALLEKHTASRFVDEFLEVPMDCSHINWVASANYEQQIPEPIRSRMEVFHIQLPSASNTQVIALNIFRELLIEEEVWGQYFTNSLSDEVLNSLQGIAPREIRKTLRKACGHVVERMGRESKQFTLTADDIYLPEQVKSRPMGFI